LNGPGDPSDLIADLEAKVEELEVEKAMAKGGQQQGARKQQRKETKVSRKEAQPPRREAQPPRKEAQLQGRMKQKMPAVAPQSFEAPLPSPRERGKASKARSVVLEIVQALAPDEGASGGDAGSV